MKPLCGNRNNSVPQSYFNQTPSFCGVTDELSKRFFRTQAEIIKEFEKDPKSLGIAGTLPASWLANLQGLNFNEQKNTIQKIFLIFRSAIKHIKPYNAKLTSKEYKIHKSELENVRLKEASKYLTKGLRKFGIIPQTNSVYLKRLKVKGNFTDRAYVLVEKGENPTLEKLFIKKFKKQSNGSLIYNQHGQFAEIAHGLYLNGNIKNNVIQKFYWGDTTAGFMATEYQQPPRHVSPIVKLKKVYESISDFATDFYKQTGIRLNQLKSQNVSSGRVLDNNNFEPFSKETIIVKYIQSILAQANLTHSDLHNANAIIGSTKEGQPIIKLIDVGGLYKRN